MSTRFATSPTSWGVDFAHTPTNPPWAEVLDQIAASGIGSLELGPVGYLPEDKGTIRAELENRGLTAIGSFLFEDLHVPTARERVLSAAVRACASIANAGGSVLVVIDKPGDDRAPTAGRSADAPRLDASQKQQLGHTLAEIAEIAERYALRVAVHPHAGSYIEFADEIDWVVEQTALDLCLDTGHLLYAGIEPARAIHTYSDRLTHMHLKDIDPQVLRRVVDGKIGFWDAIALGVFCPLGAGAVDLAGVLTGLATTGYSGFATLEQDRIPGSGEPLDDLVASLATLAEVSAQI